MKIGITLLFADIKNQKITGVLKSTVIDYNTIEQLIETADNLGSKIHKHYEYDYLGINDLFIVSGNVNEGEVLGRATYYDLIDIQKAKTLVSNNFSLNELVLPNNYNFSVVYFCKNFENENFAISVLSVADSNIKEIRDKVNLIALNKNFINKIKTYSLEKIKEIQFVGIEDICDIDLKFNVFQTFYNDEIYDIEILKKELITKIEIEEILNDILLCG